MVRVCAQGTYFRSVNGNMKSVPVQPHLVVKKNGTLKVAVEMFSPLEQDVRSNQRSGGWLGTRTNGAPKPKKSASSGSCAHTPCIRSRLDIH